MESSNWKFKVHKSIKLTILKLFMNLYDHNMTFSFFCDDNTLIWPIYCFCVGNISVLFTLPPSHVTGLATFGWATVVLVSAGRLWPSWWTLAGAPLHWSALGASDQPGDLCHSGVPVLQHTDCGPLTFPGSPGPDRVKLYNFFYTQVAILLSTIWKIYFASPPLDGIL